MNNHLTIALAQIAPVWLDMEATLAKVVAKIQEAGRQEADLVIFGEGLVPGYPFWVERTDGARFNSPVQKTLHARYLQQAVQIEAGHLAEVCAAAARQRIAVYLGIIERPVDRGGHSVYASLVYVNKNGEIKSVHRKLMPTYEERLTWSIGDGHGLRVHELGPFTVGGLNCWENWLPLARAALYGQGENLHVSVWPGGRRNTEDISRFIALESRSFVAAVSGLMRPSDFPADTPHLDLILADDEEFLANGGSCLVGPDGNWIIEPAVGEETLLVATIDHRRVLEERQNLDVSGHYSRPDVTKLIVNRARQAVVGFEEKSPEVKEKSLKKSPES